MAKAKNGAGGQGPVAGDGPQEQVMQEQTPPTWTLSAANRFDILMMCTMVGMARAGGLADRERLREMEERLREFEFYEERFHRG